MGLGIGRFGNVLLAGPWRHHQCHCAQCMTPNPRGVVVVIQFTDQIGHSNASEAFRKPGNIVLGARDATPSAHDSRHIRGLGPVLARWCGVAYCFGGRYGVLVDPPCSAYRRRTCFRMSVKAEESAFHDLIAAFGQYIFGFSLSFSNPRTLRTW